MDTLVKANIFFFIASIATVLLTVLVAVVLCYFIKAGRMLHKMVLALEEHFADSEEFVAELKERLEGNLIFRFFFPVINKRNKSHGSKKSDK